MNDFPRRIKLWLNEPIELSIRKVSSEVEKMGADVLLTDAIYLLDQAFNKVADYIDKQKANQTDVIPHQ